MLLAEPIFLSIQGEGSTTGQPSIFVRFFGCNLHCEWCDSKYAVNKQESVVNIDVDTLVKEIRKLKCQNIVFTGGEPTLFLDTIKEIKHKLGKKYTFEIETNGSREIDTYFNHINCSPKLSNSGNQPYELKIQPRGNVIYKFVCKTQEDCDRTEQYIKANNLKTRYKNIYIMPEGVDNKSQHNEVVLNYCIKYGYRYCLRQHILLFGNKKGV